MGQQQHQLAEMTRWEVEQSAKRGNAIARKIIADKPVNANAAIRHQLATGGIHTATALASQLLGINHADACMIVANLMNSKPDDIVSPHFP